jgi:hypothetical protein
MSDFELWNQYFTAALHGSSDLDFPAEQVVTWASEIANEALDTARVMQERRGIKPTPKTVDAPRSLRGKR